jgi:catechol 2,3-dioxygenase-like lactoylglutathione lyase family enzyme
MINVQRLGHVSLKVSDLDASIAFYEEVLGMRVSDRMLYAEHDPAPIAEGAWLRCNNDHHCIALFKMKEESEAEVVDSSKTPGPGLHHFAFELDRFETLLDAHSQLKERGVPVVAQRQYGPGSQIRLYCLDPDGNRIELYWDLDKIGWDGRTRPVRQIEDIDLEHYDIGPYLEYKGHPTGSATDTELEGASYEEAVSAGRG